MWLARTEISNFSKRFQNQQYLSCYCDLFSMSQGILSENEAQNPPFLIIIRIFYLLMLRFLSPVQDCTESIFYSCDMSFPCIQLSNYSDVQRRFDTISVSSDGQQHESENGAQQPKSRKESHLNLGLGQDWENRRNSKMISEQQNSGGHFSTSSSCRTFQKIKALILALMQNCNQSDRVLEELKKIHVGDDEVVGYIFDVLSRRFKKLRKTKQEMIKHCMRKAFKFIAEKNLISIKKTSVTRIFFDNYFAEEQSSSEGVEIPLGKQTSQKTMNSKFLDKVFSSPVFLEDYKQYLEKFADIAQKSNDRKTQYLVESILEFIKQGTLKKLETFKRLPWTPQILNKIISLSFELKKTYVDKKLQPPAAEKVKRKKGRPKKYEYRCPSYCPVAVLDLNSSSTTVVFQQTI